MRIESLETRIFRHKTNTVRDCHGHAHPGPERITTSALLSIVADTGDRGYIVCRSTDIPPDILENVLRPQLIGQDPNRSDFLWHRIYKWQRLSGGRLTDRTLAAVDLALWDLMGKTAGQPVWKLLGGHRDRILAYGSTMCGDTLENGLATPDDYARFAEWIIERGYRAIKLHGWMPPVPGAPDPGMDYKACAAVREAVGPDVPLMLDPHHFLSRTDALWLGQKLEELGFHWMEEPMEEASISSYRWLSSNLIKLNILGPETMTGKHWTRAEWVRNEACDILRAGVWDVGGINPAMKISHMAECFHMACEIHGTGAGNLSVAAAMSNTTFYERGLLHPFIDYDQPRAFQNRIDDEMDADGFVHCRNEPGLGQDLDLDYIEGNSVDA